MDWEGLPQNLLHEILKKLESLVDYTLFGAMCVSWHSAWEFNNMQRNSVSRHHQPPVLLVPPSTCKREWHLYDVAFREFIGRDLHVLKNKQIKGSSFGWLLNQSPNGSVMLYRPFNMTKKNQTVNLPRVPVNFWLVNKILITADPVANRNECIVLLIYSSRLIFLRLGKDSSWTKLEGPDFEHIVDAVILEGNRVYAIKDASLTSEENKGSMISFEISDSITAVDVVAPMIPSKPSSCHRYLVSSPCSEDLLQVERFVSFDPYSVAPTSSTVSFRVFKFTGKDKGWIRVTRLEDTCLFVGNNSSVSIKCSMFVGYKPNCVYFTPHNDIYSECFGTAPSEYSDLGIYDLGADEVELHYSLKSLDFADEYEPLLFGLYQQFGTKI